MGIYINICAYIYIYIYTYVIIIGVQFCGPGVNIVENRFRVSALRFRG